MSKSIKKTITLSIIVLINILVLLLIDYKCPWRKNYNIYCAGCGGTRMFFSILQLDFYQAFRYNPLLFSLLVFIVLYLIYIEICHLLKRKYYKLNISHLIILSFITIAFMIMRNIEIFSYLKPTVIS